MNQNDFTNAFTRVVKDNSAYYVLGYYPKNDRRDGGFRRIEVKMKKPRASKSTRGAATRRRAAGRPRSRRCRPAIRRHRRCARPSTARCRMSGMKLHAFAAPFKGTAPEPTSRSTVEAEGGSFAFENKDGKFVSDLEVSTIAVDYQGKIRGGDRNFVNFALKPENQGKFVATGVRIGTRLHVPPGRYQLRIAAREGGSGQGRHGQLRPRRARLHKGPVWR